MRALEIRHGDLGQTAGPVAEPFVKDVPAQQASPSWLNA
jgi:hypothetical protein